VNIGAKDLFLQIGVAVTLILGLLNLYVGIRAAKRASFVNIVTSERIKWIGSLRATVSELCALCDRWMWHRTQESIPDLQQRIERAKTELRLMLNPRDAEDTAVEALLDQLPSWEHALQADHYRSLQAQLVGATQAMLKREWDKVKAESIEGRLKSKDSNAA
jgi:hypothetical protein